jgi:hypothetical protein
MNNSHFFNGAANVITIFILQLFLKNNFRKFLPLLFMNLPSKILGRQM